jgi:hypothetical protein
MVHNQGNTFKTRKQEKNLAINVIVKKCHFDIVFQHFSQPPSPIAIKLRDFANSNLLY